MAGEGQSVGFITAEFRNDLLDLEAKLNHQTLMNRKSAELRAKMETEIAKINKDDYNGADRQAMETTIAAMQLNLNNLAVVALQLCHEIRMLSQRLSWTVYHSNLGTNNCPQSLLCRSFADVRAAIVLRRIAPWLYGIKIAVDANSLPPMEVFLEATNLFELVVVPI